MMHITAELQHRIRIATHELSTVAIMARQVLDDAGPKSGTTLQHPAIKKLEKIESVAESVVKTITSNRRLSSLDALSGYVLIVTAADGTENIYGPYPEDEADTRAERGGIAFPDEHWRVLPLRTIPA